MYYSGTHIERTIMKRLLKWFSVAQFIAAPLFIVAFIWQSDFKFFWIGTFLLIFSAITPAFGNVVDEPARWQ